jgi:hypothetical protein
MLVLAGRGVTGGVQVRDRDAVGVPVRRVPASVDLDRRDRRRDALLERLDLEPALFFLLLLHGKLLRENGKWETRNVACPPCGLAGRDPPRNFLGG